MRYALGTRLTFEPVRPRPGRPLAEPVHVVAHGSKCYVVRTGDERTFVADEDELRVERIDAFQGY